MSKTFSEAYDGECPNCGHELSLADLGRMAIGDGWERFLWVQLPNGQKARVGFSSFNPSTMTEIPSPRTVLESQEFIRL